MSIVDRAKNILTSPKTEWPIIGAEPATTGGLMTYAAILSGIAQVCGIVGGVIALSLMSSALGVAMMTPGFVIVQGIVSFILGLVVLYVMSLIAGALAPSFDGQKDSLQTLKLLTYAGTAVWVASFLAIIPGIGFIAMLIGFGYAVYLIYLGAPHTARVPEGKAGGYAAVVVIIWIVLAVVVGIICQMILRGVMGAAVVGGAGMSTY
jgi:hypothetical protein